MFRCLYATIRLALIVVLVAIAARSASAESLSKTGRDFLSITEVTPGTGSYIFTPSKFCYALTVSYNLKTSRVGTLSMRVFRLPGGGRKEILATSPEVQIIRGEGTATLKSTDIMMKAGDEIAAGGFSRVMVFVSMASSDRKELAFSSSENMLTGQLMVQQEGIAGGMDSIQLISVLPPPGTMLQAAVNSPFEIKISYNVVGVTPVYALLCFNSVKNVSSQTRLRVYHVPIPRGRGIMTIRLPLVNLPAAKRGDTLGIAVAFFNNIGEKALTNDLIWPYNLTR